MSVCTSTVHVFPLTLAAISTAVCSSTTPGMFLYRRLCCALLCPHVRLNGGHYWPIPRQVSVTCFQLRFLDVICFKKCQSLSGMIIYLFPSGSQPASVINQREVYMRVHVWWPMNGYILLGCSEEWLKLLHLGETTPSADCQPATREWWSCLLRPLWVCTRVTWFGKKTVLRLLCTVFKVR